MWFAAVQRISASSTNSIRKESVASRSRVEESKRTAVARRPSTLLGASASLPATEPGAALVRVTYPDRPLGKPSCVSLAANASVAPRARPSEPNGHPRGLGSGWMERFQPRLALAAAVAAASLALPAPPGLGAVRTPRAGTVSPAQVLRAFAAS